MKLCCGRTSSRRRRSAATQAAIEQLYVDSGRSIGQVVEAPTAPRRLHGAPLVKPPAVYTAGLLRATGQPITTDDWAWLGPWAGRHPFYPPNVVAGWNDCAWLDTSRLMRRWLTSTTAMNAHRRLPAHRSSSTETGTEALAAASRTSTTRR